MPLPVFSDSPYQPETLLDTLRVRVIGRLGEHGTINSGQEVLWRVELLRKPWWFTHSDIKMQWPLLGRDEIGQMEKTFIFYIEDNELREHPNFRVEGVGSVGGNNEPQSGSEFSAAIPALSSDFKEESLSSGKSVMLPVKIPGTKRSVADPLSSLVQSASKRAARTHTLFTPGSTGYQRGQTSKLTNQQQYTKGFPGN